jgi:hypothetical protein
MNEEFTTDESWNYIKELLFKGVQINGSLIECEQKTKAIQKVVETVENALKLEKNGE